MGHVNTGSGPVGQILLTFDLEIWDMLRTSVNNNQIPTGQSTENSFQKQIPKANVNGIQLNS